MTPMPALSDAATAPAPPDRDQPPVPQPDIEAGLAEDMARARLAEPGPNALSEERIGLSLAKILSVRS